MCVCVFVLPSPRRDALTLDLTALTPLARAPSHLSCTLQVFMLWLLDVVAAQNMADYLAFQGRETHCGGTLSGRSRLESVSCRGGHHHHQQASQNLQALESHIVAYMLCYVHT